MSTKYELISTVGVIVKLRIVGLFIILGELYTTDSEVGSTVFRANVDINTFLVGLYRLAVLLSPTFLSNTWIDTVDLYVNGRLSMLAKEMVTLVLGIIA